MTRAIGYVRELLASDDPIEAVAALRLAGASKVYVDRRSDRTRPELDRCLQALASGDTLLIASAATLVSSVEQYVVTVAQLKSRGIHLHSIAEPALSTIPNSAMSSADALDALDALRRGLIGLRTREGLDAAAAAGRKPGRPRVMTDERLAVAKELRAQKRSFAQIGRALGVSEAAVRRALTAAAPPPNDQVKIE
ncbi:recombinase family protein [Microbacterium sp. 2FI]|uniref:recombinase family protein n=1 Tax=Microbacterium sp. 2FI TaxID=2502193 RepID=UPI0010F69EF1|nr:recombinase family protein [Microbacterium sp. 2FI]